MAWVYLVIAGLMEVFWSTCLKFSEGFTVLKFTVLTIVGMVISFLFLSQATKTLPLGTSYAIWTGIGAQLRIKDVTVDGTPLTYSYSPDEDAFRYSIGGYYYENNGKAVCTATSFNAADTVPEITSSSSISFSLDIGGPASGDWSGMKTIGPLSVPI